MVCVDRGHRTRLRQWSGGLLGIGAVWCGEGTRRVKKEAALQLVQGLPDEFDPEELMYRLYVITKIEKSEDSIQEHGLIPDEELEREIQEWRD